MIRVSGREHNGLIESPCYRGPVLVCRATLHSSEPDDQLARKPHGQSSLHTVSRTVPLGDRNNRPYASQCRIQRSRCYNCHMPHTSYGVLTAIRSHQISSPRIADQLATGRPNACNLCHLTNRLAWTAGQLTDWFRHSTPRSPAMKLPGGFCPVALPATRDSARSWPGISAGACGASFGASWIPRSWPSF